MRHTRREDVAFILAARLMVLLRQVGYSQRENVDFLLLQLKEISGLNSASKGAEEEGKARAQRTTRNMVRSQRPDASTDAASATRLKDSKWKRKERTDTHKEKAEMHTQAIGSI